MSSDPESVANDELRKLRQSLGGFATGVVVVTCRGADGPCGITANSFSSVSLEPPLILWNIAKVSNSLQTYIDAEYFVINVLRANQVGLSRKLKNTVRKLYVSSVTDYRPIPDTRCAEVRASHLRDARQQRRSYQEDCRSLRKPRVWG